MVDKEDLQTAVNLIIIGEAIAKAGKMILKQLKKGKRKRPRKRNRRK